MMTPGRATLLFSLIIVVIWGIYGLIFPSVTWTEDVQLSDGTTVQVQRKHRYSTTHPLGGAVEYMLNAAELRMRGQQPGTWATAKWSGPLRALLLDKDEETGEFFLVAITPSCVVLHELGVSDRYLEYRYRSGQWQQVPLSASLIGREANLLLSVRRKEESGHVNVVDKAMRDSSLRVYRPYKRIDPASENPCV